MKIAFPIWRLTNYRKLTPVIEEALARGFTVECWHDYGRDRGGHKGYNFPDLEGAPKFSSGTPVFRTYRESAGLHALLQSQRPDALVTWRSPRDLLGPQRRSPVPYVMVQESAAFFLRDRASADDLAEAAALGVYSEHWLEWGLRIMREDGRLSEGDRRSNVIRAKSRVVGFPELDACGMLDRSAIRASLGLPAGKPVVAFMPYPYDSNPRSFWSRWIYANPRPWLQAAMIFAHGEHRYWTHVRRGWHDRNLVRAVRAFCDANGAVLVVKYREKDPIPRYLQDAADVAIADPAQWPPTILEVLAVADLAVSFYSLTVLESAFLGVPYLCIGFGDVDWYGHLDRAWSASRFDTTNGSQFNFPGVTELTTIPELITGLPRRRLTEFRTDPERRRAYVAKFLGHDDGRSAARTVDLALDAAGRA